MSETRGTIGYAENAADLIARYELLPFAYKHAEVLHLIPTRPSRVLDVGAGSGLDAAWLASMGHEVCAVEPTFLFRQYAERNHASPRVEWVDDCLPSLDRVVERRQTFSLIMVTAVWDDAERRKAMAVLASLLESEGTCC